MLRLSYTGLAGHYTACASSAWGENMATNDLARLVERAKTDTDFIARAQRDLDGTLAAEGFTLSSEEMEAVRAAHAELASFSPAEVQVRLAPDVQGYAG